MSIYGDPNASAIGGFSHREAGVVPQPSARARRVDLELDEGARRLTLLERDHNTLQRACEDQATRLAQVEKRLDALMAERARERHDVPSNDHRSHHVIARDYDAFVEQRVQSLARAATRTLSDALAPSDAPAVPWLMSKLCAVLFGPHEPDTATILSALGGGRLDPLAPQASRARDTALDLRRRTQQTVLPCHWDFELLPGEPLDDEWQQAWPSCDATLPGQFVIAPAYIVAEQVYSLQRVYTGRSIPE
ncbi:hypothetical protein N0X72_00830 [Streptomyces carpaticus]|uniref:hypothetical protein n=1 Tax=Streptomyces carpaticus TaxID=285558 RepID=UPI0022064B88|nr:hypothetical protein N0X72_00830 [Streptomyces carpaticus]